MSISLPRHKDTFTVRYLHDSGSLTPDFFTNGASLPGFDTYQGGPSELGQGTWTHIFSPSFLNEFRAAETRITFSLHQPLQTLANPLYTAPQISTDPSQRWDSIRPSRKAGGRICTSTRTLFRGPMAATRCAPARISAVESRRISMV